MTVFPARAGLCRKSMIRMNVMHSFPRTRGVVPKANKEAKAQAEFSPHARGCSRGLWLLSGVVFVFPACAGLFPQRLRQNRVLQSFPRMRGVVPAAERLEEFAGEFSPHARGCSRLLWDKPSLVRVFPACAGLFPGEPGVKGEKGGFLRTRGVVPTSKLWSSEELMFSPHAAGLFRAPW